MRRVTATLRAATVLAAAGLLGSGGARGAPPVPATGAPEPPALPAAVEEALGELPELLAAGRRQHRLPGLSVAVVRGQETIFAAAVGDADLEAGRPATAETPYRAASVTKLFTATLLMKLAEAGTVRLDDPVVRYLPEYRVRSPYAGTRPTTLRQLVSHTSGLPRAAPIAFWSLHRDVAWVVSGGAGERQPPPAPEEVLGSLATAELDHRPNSLFGHYSNLGFSLLGHALARAAGQPYHRLVEEEVLRPLGMAGSGFEPPAEGPPPAVGYAAHHGGDGGPLRVPPRRDGAHSPAGGLWSTAPDLARFLALQFRSGPVGGAQVISGDSLRAIQRLTWALRFDPRHPALDHSGGVLGYCAYVRIVPSLQLGVAALANEGSLVVPTNPCREVGAEVLGRVQEAILAASSAGGGDPAAEPERYTGTYSLPGGFARIEIEADGEGRLFHTVVGDPASRMRILPAAPDRFYFAGDPTRTPWVVFEAGESGEVRVLQSGTYRFRRVEEGEGH